MSEFHIIGLGNLCEFVIKNIDEKQTYGTFSACDKHDRKSMQEFVDYVNQMIKENEELKVENKELKSKVDDITVAVEVETCKVMENVIDLIDKKVMEMEQIPFMRDGEIVNASCKQFTIDILNELKKELKE